ADDRMALALGDRKIDAADDGQRAEGLAELDEFQDGLRAHRAASSAGTGRAPFRSSSARSRTRSQTRARRRRVGGSSSPPAMASTRGTAQVAGESGSHSGPNSSIGG